MKFNQNQKSKKKTKKKKKKKKKKTTSKPFLFGQVNCCSYAMAKEVMKGLFFSFFFLGKNIK
jgi:hypothetical protein